MSKVNLNENTCEHQTDQAANHQLVDDFEFEYAKKVNKMALSNKN